MIHRNPERHQKDKESQLDVFSAHGQKTDGPEGLSQIRVIAKPNLESKHPALYARHNKWSVEKGEFLSFFFFFNSELFLSGWA